MPSPFHGERLKALRTEAGWSQAELAEKIGSDARQVSRYEAGTSQPTLEVLRGLAVGLSVSTDALVFKEDERGPADNQLPLHLEALNQLDDDEKATVSNLIESVLRHHQARRLARSS